MATLIDQLDSMRRLGENWDGYGSATVQPRAIDLAIAFVDLISAVRKISGPSENGLHVNPTRTGGVLIEWDDHAKEHEIEIGPDGGVSFLHLNKVTGEIQSQKFLPGDPAVVQPELLLELKCSEPEPISEARSPTRASPLRW